MIDAKGMKMQRRPHIKLFWKATTSSQMALTSMTTADTNKMMVPMASIRISCR